MGQEEGLDFYFAQDSPDKVGGPLKEVDKKKNYVIDNFDDEEVGADDIGLMGLDDDDVPAPI